MTTPCSRFARIFAPALVAVLAGPPLAAAAEPPAFHMPVPVVRTLPNGLRVAVFPQSRLPIVQMQLVVPAGAAQEAATTLGAASATAQLLRAGTTSRSAADLVAEVDRLGGSLTTSASRDFSTAGAAFLAADFEAGLELLADVVVNPVFPPEELARYRALSAMVLLPRQQDPAAVADERLWAAVFADHPYGRSLLGSLQSLPALTVEAVQMFYRDFYRPDRAILAIAGDVDPERAFAAAADRFGNWAGRFAEPPAVPAPAPRPGPRILLLDRPGAARCEVRVGFVGPGQGSPDGIALQLADRILGARGVTSRDAGAPGPEGDPSGGLRSSLVLQRSASLASFSSASPADSVGALLTRLRDGLARLGSQAPEEAEVAAARRYLQGAHPLQLQTLGSVVAQWLGAELYGLGDDWLDRYDAQVGAVTAEQVRGATARWLDPSRMVTLAVGPESALRGPLGSLGAVEAVEPGAGDVAAAATAPVPAPASPEQKARGRDLLAKTLVAHGGLQRLRRVMDSTVEGSLVVQVRGNTYAIEMRQVRKEPLRLRYSTRLADMENGQILNGERGWLYLSAGDSLKVTDADPSGIEGLRAAFRADIVHSLLGAADPSAEVVWRGTGTTEGRDVDLVEVTAPGGAPTEQRLLHLDAADHRLLAEDLGDARVRSGAEAVHRTYRDFRRVGGVLWPFQEESFRGGTKTLTMVVKSVVLDSGVADALFERPARPAPRRLPR